MTIFRLKSTSGRIARDTLQARMGWQVSNVLFRFKQHKNSDGLQTGRRLDQVHPRTQVYGHGLDYHGAHRILYGRLRR